jgi:hypothetical protein
MGYYHQIQGKGLVLNRYAREGLELRSPLKIVLPFSGVPLRQDKRWIYPYKIARKKGIRSPFPKKISTPPSSAGHILSSSAPRAEGPSAFPFMKELVLVYRLALSRVCNEPNLYTVVHVPQKFNQPEEEVPGQILLGGSHASRNIHQDSEIPNGLLC